MHWCRYANVENEGGLPWVYEGFRRFRVASVIEGFRRTPPTPRVPPYPADPK